ncbi:MAG: RsmE family RNA methyltransferase [Pseudomonadota bacterium]
MKHRLCIAGNGDLSRKTESNSELTLDRDQSHYLTRVLRLGPGAGVGLFDGKGREWQGSIVAIDGKRATVAFGPLYREAPAPTPLIVAIGWLKGSAMDRVLQKAVELGATDLWIIEAERSNVSLKGDRRTQKLAHYERIMISAAEQCETLWLPKLVATGPVRATLNRERPATGYLLDPGAPVLAPGSDPQPAMILVGPEGGWTDGERAVAMDAGLTAAGLGPLTLRAETAPLAALAALKQSWGWRP